MMKLMRTYAAAAVLCSLIIAAAASEPQFQNPKSRNSVEDFGAKCDGSTDDSNAFRVALAATPAGGALRVPPSNLGCIVSQDGTNPWAIRISKPIKLFCKAPNSIIRPSDATPGNVDTISISVTNA
jgi:hypothetical protein